MPLSHEQLEKVLARLAADENWGKVSPEIQKEEIDELHRQIAGSIVDSHVDAVESEGKKRTRKRRATKSEGDAAGGSTESA